MAKTHTFFVVHGSVSGKQLGESLELTQEQADHINASGKMLRREDEPETARERKKTGVRLPDGPNGKAKEVPLDGNVVETEADTEPSPGDAPAADEPAVKPTKKSKKKGG